MDISTIIAKIEEFEQRLQDLEARPRFQVPAPAPEPAPQDKPVESSVPQQ